MDVFLSFSVKSENITTKINPEENSSRKQRRQVREKSNTALEVSQNYCFLTVMLSLLLETLLRKFCIVTFLFVLSFNLATVLITLTCIWIC